MKIVTKYFKNEIHGGRIIYKIIKNYFHNKIHDGRNFLENYIELLKLIFYTFFILRKTVFLR